MKIATQHGDSTAEKLEQKVSDSEEQYKKILDVMPVPVLFVVRTGGLIIHANQRACTTFGFPYEEFLKQTMPCLYEIPEDRERFFRDAGKKREGERV